MRSTVTDPTRPIWMLTLALPEAPAVVPLVLVVLEVVVLVVLEVVVGVVVLLASSPPEVLTVAEGVGA